MDRSIAARYCDLASNSTSQRGRSLLPKSKMSFFNISWLLIVMHMPILLMMGCLDRISLYRDQVACIETTQSSFHGWLRFPSWGLMVSIYRYTEYSILCVDSCFRLWNAPCEYEEQQWWWFQALWILLHPRSSLSISPLHFKSLFIIANSNNSRIVSILPEIGK